jgi:hypothetical protein
MDSYILDLIYNMCDIDTKTYWCRTNKLYYKRYLDNLSDFIVRCRKDIKYGILIYHLLNKTYMKHDYLYKFLRTYNNKSRKSLQIPTYKYDIEIIVYNRNKKEAIIRYIACTNIAFYNEVRIKRYLSKNDVCHPEPKFILTISNGKYELYSRIYDGSNKVYSRINRYNGFKLIYSEDVDPPKWNKNHNVFEHLYDVLSSDEYNRDDVNMLLTSLSDKRMFF